ncbi:hypothetical protein HanRHA438_Chr17g0792161 [Helianthus annuus]|nr:hypothetical protein HanRHA438_Chr17g0792161 [Helianthus annuus]
MFELYYVNFEVLYSYLCVCIYRYIGRGSCTLIQKCEKRSDLKLGFQISCKRFFGCSW